MNQIPSSYSCFCFSRRCCGSTRGSRFTPNDFPTFPEHFNPSLGRKRFRCLFCDTPIDECGERTVYRRIKVLVSKREERTGEVVPDSRLAATIDSDFICVC